MTEYERTQLLYENPLTAKEDIDDFVMEGEGIVSFPLDRMRMENRLPRDAEEVPHFVHWCPEDFPDGIEISWEFHPIREPGLAILFFAAKGRNGEDIFASEIENRSGDYPEYHSGDINALHVSYFRRNFQPDPQLCNLRKSHGFDLVAQGADPIPSTMTVNDPEYGDPPYRISVVKDGPTVKFSIDDLGIFEWEDDGEMYGPVLGGGKVGFRQMAPLMAEYADLQVHSVEPVG